MRNSRSAPIAGLPLLVVESVLDDSGLPPPLSAADTAPPLTLNAADPAPPLPLNADGYAFSLSRTHSRRRLAGRRESTSGVRITPY